MTPPRWATCAMAAPAACWLPNRMAPSGTATDGSGERHTGSTAQSPYAAAAAHDRAMAA